MAGLTAVRVNVDLKLPSAALLSRTDTARIGTAVTDALVSHGWRIADPASESTAPLLYVGVLVVQGPSAAAVRYECTLTELVERVRDHAVIPASTWSSGGQVALVLTPNELPDAIVNGVLGVVAKFNRERGPIRPQKTR